MRSTQNDVRIPNPLSQWRVRTLWGGKEGDGEYTRCVIHGLLRVERGSDRFIAVVNYVRPMFLWIRRVAVMQDVMPPHVNWKFALRILLQLLAKVWTGQVDELVWHDRPN